MIEIPAEKLLNAYPYEKLTSWIISIDSLISMFIFWSNGFPERINWSIPSESPTETVVFPSPAGVGVIAVTKISCPVFLFSSFSIYSKLIRIINPSQIKCDSVYLHSYARDASFYRLVPKAVVLPEKNVDIQSLFRFANHNLIPLTFRAGGTSLSGQSITNHILVDISRGWKTVKIKDNLTD